MLSFPRLATSWRCVFHAVFSIMYSTLSICFISKADDDVVYIDMEAAVSHNNTTLEPVYCA